MVNRGWARALAVTALTAVMSLAAPAAFADGVDGSAEPSDSVSVSVTDEGGAQGDPAAENDDEITTVVDGDMVIDLIPATSQEEPPPTKPAKTGKPTKTEAAKTGKAPKPSAAKTANAPAASQPAIDVLGTSATAPATVGGDSAPSSTVTTSPAVTSPASSTAAAPSTSRPSVSTVPSAEVDVIDVLGASSEIAADAADTDSGSGLIGWIVIASALLVAAAGGALALRRRSSAHSGDPS